MSTDDKHELTLRERERRHTDDHDHDLQSSLRTLAQEAKRTARALGRARAEQRASAIREIAHLLETHREEIKRANELDLSHAQGLGLSDAMIDRLHLTDHRLSHLKTSLLEIASAPDPVGQVSRSWERPNGLKVSKMRLPLGVILMIYESRPNVTLDAAALCLKSGNCSLLRGGTEAVESNRALFALIQRALVTHQLPIASVQMLPTQDRTAIDHLLQMSDEINLVIPRGGAQLIRRVVSQSRIPVVRHDQGICHLYVHAEADLEKALAITLNAKVQRPGVCNAIETLLIDREVAAQFLPVVLCALHTHGVHLKLCPIADQLSAETLSESERSKMKIDQATQRDWATEFLSLTLAIRVVDGLDQAIEHIDRFGSDHSASIITQSQTIGDRFIREVDASCVLMNASTRFNDGGALGLGAEVGISTTRVHAFGPMGVEALTSEKFVVYGDGHIRD